MQTGTQVTSKPSDRGEQGEGARQMLNAGCFAVRVLCTCGGRTAAAAVLSSLRGGKVSSPFALAAMEADSEEKRALDSFACVQRAHSLPSLTGVYSAAQFVHTFGTMGSAKQKAGGQEAVRESESESESVGVGVGVGVRETNTHTHSQSNTHANFFLSFPFSPPPLFLSISSFTPFFTHLPFSLSSHT